MQIKTVLKYHLKPVRNVIIKKSTNKKCWGGGDLPTLLVRATTAEIGAEVPLETENRATWRKP